MTNRSFRTWSIRAGLAVLAGVALYLTFRPLPVPVDLAHVERGPLQVTVNDDGETRVREVYVVSAPLPGRVLRFQGDVGDPVTAGETVLAYIVPTSPAFLDVRTRSQLDASLEAAEAARDLAAAEIGRTEAEMVFARTELRRSEELAAEGTISVAALDRARKEARAADAGLQTARAALEVREHELVTARAALISPLQPASSALEHRSGLPVRAPVSGSILRIFHESEGVIPAGTTLAEIGDPTDLEVVVDLLSADAVLVSAGDEVRIERWGGERPINGVVRRVEPYGITKISALGIEEQRVNVIIDLTDPIENWRRLGHGYKVEAQIVRWHEDDVLQVPTAALFRRGAAWATFVVRDGRAQISPVEVGATNGRMAQVLAGLHLNEVVVLYPSDRVTEGSLVEPRAMPGDVL